MTNNFDLFCSDLAHDVFPFFVQTNRTCESSAKCLVVLYYFSHSERTQLFKLELHTHLWVWERSWGNSIAFGRLPTVNVDLWFESVCKTVTHKANPDNHFIKHPCNSGSTVGNKTVVTWDHIRACSEQDTDGQFYIFKVYANFRKYKIYR